MLGESAHQARLQRPVEQLPPLAQLLQRALEALADEIGRSGTVDEVLDRARLAGLRRHSFFLIGNIPFYIDQLRVDIALAFFRAGDAGFPIGDESFGRCAGRFRRLLRPGQFRIGLRGLAGQRFTEGRGVEREPLIELRPSLLGQIDLQRQHRLEFRCQRNFRIELFQLLSRQRGVEACILDLDFQQYAAQSVLPGSTDSVASSFLPLDGLLAAAGCLFNQFWQ